MKLVPSLVVRDAKAAIKFYEEALGAKVLSCFVDEKLKPGGHVVHADLTIGDAKFALSDEARDWHNHAPPSLGATPVILTIETDDARGVWARLVKAGAKVIFPLEDHFYGYRQGRVEDPFGHMWLVSQEIEKLSSDEIQKRIEAYVPPAK